MKYIKTYIAVLICIALLSGSVFYLKSRVSKNEEEASVVISANSVKPERIITDSILVHTPTTDKKDILKVCSPENSCRKEYPTEDSKRSLPMRSIEKPVIPNIDMQPLLTETAIRNMEEEGVLKDSMRLQSVKKTGSYWENDTIPVKKGVDLLRIKKVGRFDRGIVNYRFMPKGAWMFGLDVSFWDFDVENNKMLFAYLDNFDFNARTVTFAPFLSYFFRDNQAIGVKLGYKYTNGHLGNISIKIDDDVNFSLKELKLDENIYHCTFFHRSYIGLDQGKRFGLFNETSLNVGFGTSEFSRGSGEKIKNVKTNIFETQLGISPGLAVFIMQNVSVECSVGVLGLKFRKESQSNNIGETGSRMNGGANFKINLFDINLGMIISL